MSDNGRQASPIGPDAAARPAPHRRKTTAGWALAICAGISLGLHALLLLPPPSGLADGGAQSVRPPPYRTKEPARAVVRMRFVEGSAAPGADNQSTSATETDRPPVPRQPSGPSANAAPAGQSNAMPLQASTPARPASEFDDYLPRQLLSMPPRAIDDIVIASPLPDGPAGIRHVGILTLFIDEAGQVRHVAPGDIELPPELEQAAREAFTAGRFSPGEINGRPTRSRLQVEVTFE